MASGGVVKGFFDWRWAWDVVIGPIYNRIIFKAASEVYGLIVETVRVPEGADVLDVGAGPGYVTRQIAEENPTASVVGIDYSATEVRFAEKVLAESGLKNCRFMLGDAMELAFEDESFDVVVSVASIKYWPDAKRGLEEIHRVLKPNGSAYIVEGDKDGSEEEIDKFARGHAKWCLWRRFMLWGFRRIAYSKGEAESVARDAGFSDVVVEKMPEWPFLIMKIRKDAGGYSEKRA